jgi:hypothetical protein
MIAYQLTVAYLTIAIMGVGFALMAGGPLWSGAALRFFFSRPLSALARGTAWVVWSLLRVMLAAVSHMLLALCQLLIIKLIDPAARLLRRIINRLLFPRRS